MPSSSLFMHVLLRLHVCNIHAQYRGLTTNKAQMTKREKEREERAREGGRVRGRGRECVRWMAVKALGVPRHSPALLVDMRSTVRPDMFAPVQCKRPLTAPENASRSECVNTSNRNAASTEPQISRLNLATLPCQSGKLRETNTMWYTILQYDI